jgi:hypothetical protein
MEDLKWMGEGLVDEVSKYPGLFNKHYFRYGLSSPVKKRSESIETGLNDN